METWIAQTRKGLIELCVLATLKDAEAYGYQILQRLAAADCLAIGESTVYPILARLAKDGMVKVRVAASPGLPAVTAGTESPDVSSLWTHAPSWRGRP